MLHYEIVKNNLILFHHKKNKSLPINGWIHNCFICKTITSKLVNYNNNNKIYTTICKDCEQKFINNKYAEIESFIKDLNLDKYI
jgi:hypothetical protein